MHTDFYSQAWPTKGEEDWKRDVYILSLTDKLEKHKSFIMNKCEVHWKLH